MDVQRGLSYYTSFAIETNIQNLELSDDKGKKIDISGISCASGGRYSKLTSRFGVDIDGSGASIGCDRVAFIVNQFKNKNSYQKKKASSYFGFRWKILSWIL